MDGSEIYLGELGKELLHTVACQQCCKTINSIDVQLSRPHAHLCNGNMLLVKFASGGKNKGQKNAPPNRDVWKVARRRPTCCQPHKYFVCWHFNLKEGCSVHRARCTFAWSEEEVALWSFEKKHKCTQAQMIEAARRKIREQSSKGTAATGAAPEQDTISEVAIKQMDEFGGTFREICCQCFYSVPQVISEDACRRLTPHWPWKGLLVHVSKTDRSVSYKEVRPLNDKSRLAPCHHALKQRHCPKSQICSHSHNDVELSVWKAETSDRLNRAHLLKLSAKIAPAKKHAALPTDAKEELPERIYCCFCLVTCESPQQFAVHKTSAEHRRMIAMDSDLDWQHRSPPLNVTNGRYTRCIRGEECELGRECPRAHSTEELHEWESRLELRQSRATKARQLGLQPYREQLLDKYASSQAEVSVIAEKIDDAAVECQTSLSKTCQLQHHISWTFNVTSKSPLSQVALLQSDPDISFQLVGQGLGETCVEAKGDVFAITPATDPGKNQGVSLNPQDGDKASHHAIVQVSFKATRYGSYQQWLVFDFGSEPVLKKELHVEVVDAAAKRVDLGNVGHVPVMSTRWHSGNRTVMLLRDYSEDDHRLLARYKRPAVTLDPLAKRPLPPQITADNYQQSLHTALYREEAAQETVLSRLNLQTEVLIKKMVHMPTGEIYIASTGMLFAEVPIPPQMGPDSEEGMLLRRSVDVALVALPGSEDGSPVYEVSLSKDLCSVDCLRLLLPESVCRALALDDGTSRPLDVQFQLDHLTFCIRHAAVDQMDARLILPDITNCALPTTRPGILPATLKGNDKQKKVIMFAVGERTCDKPTPPFLMYGPFGTGKTYTLFQATVQILAEPNARVLICTEANSAADLYIQEYLHEYVTSGFKEATPLRIVYKWRNMNTVSEVVRRYCCLDPNGPFFAVPSLEIVKAHRVVIATYAQCRTLWQLELPRGHFSHILLDEAAQALEADALIPLALADSSTRVLLAGDHKQITPKLYSMPNDDKQFVIRTLLQRLFHHYQRQNHNTAQCSRIILTDNYRSRPEIVNFVSKHFYLGNHDKDFKGIKARADVPRHPDLYPLTFSHVSGKCDFDEVTRTWYNTMEALEVAERVANILQTWPEIHGRLEQSQICVISYYSSQIKLIRYVLRRKHMGSVNVDTLQSIQGKEFTVIVLSTVRTRSSRQSMVTDGNLGFLADACALNTAMTRARALVLAVGDAMALCSVGGCSRVWQSFLREAHVHSSMLPLSMVPEDIAASLSDLARLEGVERRSQLPGLKEESWASGDNGESDALNDPILSELLYESKAVYILTTKEGYTTISEKNSEEANSSPPPTTPANPEITSGNKNIQKKFINHSKDTLQELLTTQPHVYKHCEIVIQSFRSGYGIPKDRSIPPIYLKSRESIGCSFSGDEVVIEILSKNAKKQGQKAANVGEKNTNYSGRVVGVLNQDVERHDSVVCGVDLYDANIMIPIDKCMPKIYNPPIDRRHSPNRNKVAVRKKCPDGRWYFHEHLKDQNRSSKLFLVKIKKWHRNLPYPLGIVVDVLPEPKDVRGQLEMFKENSFLKNAHHIHSMNTWEYEQDHANNNGKDCRKIFTFTVDPPGARDLDDAISVEDLGTCFKIGVHIADVVQLVRKDSDEDTCAQEQGNTYYEDGKRTFHMLPEGLCEACSLLPGQDRSAFSLFFTFKKDSSTTEQLETSFEQTVIRSKWQLTYDEAETIISRYGEMPLKIKSSEDYIAVAFFFSRMLRQERLHAGALYIQPEENRPIDGCRGHIMVEEFAITTNHLVAKRLLENKATADITPLCHQLRPDSDEINNYLEEYKSVIPFSLSLTSILSPMPTKAIGNLKTPSHLEFMQFIWEKMKKAIQDKDSFRLFTLIALDDMHPFLVAAVKEFRKIQFRSMYICSSAPSTDMGHYSLRLPFYTKSTSPIRRYIDVVVQRLLAAISMHERPAYTPDEMEILCRNFNDLKKGAADLEKLTTKLKFSEKLSIRGSQKLALISSIDEQSKNFDLVFPLDRINLPDYYNVNFQSLQLATQPVFDKDENGRKNVSVQWRIRMYSVKSDANQIPPMPKHSSTEVCNVRLESWEKVLLAAKKNNFEEASRLIQEEDEYMDKIGASKSSTTPLKDKDYMKEHFNIGDVVLKTGTPVRVQLGVRVQRTFLSPTVQLLSLNEAIPDICLEHAEDPVSTYKCHAEFQTRDRYKNVKSYQEVWAPLSAMESVTVAVNEHSSIMLCGMKILWSSNDERDHSKGGIPTMNKDKLKGMFVLKKVFLDKNFIKCDFRHCYLCIRCKINPTKGAQGQKLTIDSDWYTWVCHAKTTEVHIPKVNHDETCKNMDDTEVKVKFVECTRSMQEIPKEICNKYQPYIIELIPKSITDVRKEKAIQALYDAPLAKDIALGYDDIARKHRHRVTEKKDFNIPGFQLNIMQTTVIKQSLTSAFTVIQGPPGTGKTVVGIHLVKWFHEVIKTLRENLQADAKHICSLYCGPSNKSVDVVAEHLVKIEDLKPLRVYGQQTEEEEFPIPGETDVIFLRSKKVPRVNLTIKSITLHYKIREDTNPYAQQIRKYDERIKILKIKKEEKEKRERAEKEKLEATEQSMQSKNCEDSHPSVAQLDEFYSPDGQTEEVKDLTLEEIIEYKKLIKDAKVIELKKSDVVITTCSTAATVILLKNLDPRVCLVDECAMCTEPECLIPLTSYKDIAQVVLLGDHKQLRPFVLNRTAAKLGMEKSMFERYAKRAIMLDTQYRMHPDICEFPAKQFYSETNKTLKTAKEVFGRPNSILGYAHKPSCPTLFGHVVGKEVTLVVSTEEGSENSKANKAEVEQVVRLVSELIKKGSIAEKDIAILTPYNAQANEIQKALEKEHIKKVTATTITKSQGSEWRYVLLSTVRSCSLDEFKANPSRGWQISRLGFIIDENQVNVALTRAKEGLCIIGNQDLLMCSDLWKELIESYHEKDCLGNADKIIVSSAK
ncbi:3'-5' exoribonuclease HELZ2 [Petromyzon marinus]|uniref:3'-5' exoribonuclease HELZ2 n=1 Tax=Petromyzon marinus TaxID=7757 RepID=UPI003F6EE871